MPTEVKLRRYSLKNKEYELGAELNCYASGSGALSFVFVKKGGPDDGKALPEKVSHRDIEWYMRTRDKGMKIDYLIADMSCYAGPVAVKRVKRLSHNELWMAGKKYKYSGLDHTLDVWVLEDGEWYRTEHLSTKAPLNFYLKYEDELLPLFSGRTGESYAEV